jgi:hypothetical protein
MNTVTESYALKNKLADKLEGFFKENPVPDGFKLKPEITIVNGESFVNSHISAIRNGKSYYHKNMIDDIKKAAIMIYEEKNKEN